MLHRRETHPLVGVLRASGSYCLVSTSVVPAGARLFWIDGRESSQPSRYSVQVDRDLHVQVDPERPLEEILDLYSWRYMNHSCEPNTIVRGREFIALRDIERGEAITFNYNTSEYDMAEPFACQCGSARCEGTIRGFRHLSTRQQSELRPLLSAHLLEMMDTEDDVFDPGGPPA